MENETITSELYFLIAKFLKNSPCEEAFKKLVEELDRNDLLPARYDWTGEKHKQSFQEIEAKFHHVGNSHILDICNRIFPLLNSEFKKSIKYEPSLLGDGNCSVLRIKETERKFFPLKYYYARRHGIPLPEPITFRKHHIVKALYGRELSGPFNRKHVLAGCPYKNFQLLGRTQGHLSAVYCVLFDSSGRYIFTGADDLLVKVWHAISGRLLTTLRGASAEITDLAVNYENTLLAAGSVDKMVRVWCLQTAFPVATLVIHTGMITGVNFCPAVVNGCRYLASTATDGSVAFWKYATNDTETSFEQTPVQYLERMRPGCAQILCGSFSPGGMFLATGSADHHVRVYKMAGPEGPQRVLENPAHTERVDSIQWAHTHLRFASGSKDGTCLIWYFEQQTWKSICLPMKGSKEIDDDPKVKLRVTMLTWDKSDQWVITASSDNSIKVWDSFTGVLVQTLIGHKDETYVIESHPLDSKIILSAGHDGKLFLWNIITGEYYANFQNNIDGQGCGAVFDAKWSPDGTSFAATDSHGQILVYGLGMPDVTRKVPPALFFHTDYRPLTRDINNQVLDEQTQMPPHLMPPPFLVDMDGNPYPPYLQRLVPGREHCDIDQLVPNVVLSDEGHHEVIMEADENEFLLGADLGESSRRSTSHLRSRVGMRRTGDIEGVRQSSGNWQRGDNISWTKRLICEPLDKHRINEISQRVQFLASIENEEYKKESKKPMAPEPQPEEIPHKRLPRRKKTHHTYRTRASRTEQLEMEFENADISSADSQDENDLTAHESNLDSSSSSTENDASSDYSDWTADHGMNKLEPPKRVARVRNVRRATRIKRIVANNNSTKKPAPMDIPEDYRPSEWLSETMPKKAPYYPQMGDEVMFFQQGYNLYLNTVQNKNIYKVKPAQLNPWGKIKLKEPQLCKLVGMKYEIRPPRLCGLRLAVMNEDRQLTAHSFDLKYHDISDVIDFLVLRQLYDVAMSRNWKLGDRFRSAIDDAWWCGKIIHKSKNAQSPFLCYKIRWDNGEDEHLSPWDLEPLNSRREPQNGQSLPILPREMKNILYRPEADEWPGGDQDTACERILRGLEDLMSMSIAEHFLAPVDISMYPAYAYVVEYPIDLSTIKARFENRFYRRLASAQFDARYIASNAEKFNECDSNIVKHARIITDILLKIMKATLPLDVPALCRQLQENYVSTDSTEEEAEANMSPGPSSRPRLRPVVSKRNSRNLRLTRGRRARGPRQPFDWKISCKELLQLLWISDDSEPFRQPVDRLEHPDYDKIIDTPMDLSIIREELKGDNYDSPQEFFKDLKIMFNNAKNYTPNKKSRIYAMTVRLSNLAEEQMRTIQSNYRSTTNRKSAADSSQERKPRRASKRKRGKDSSPNEESSDAASQPSTSTGIGRRGRRLRIESPRKMMSLRSPRKVKSLLKTLSTSESEEEVSVKHDTQKDSLRSQRRLRTRKTWNYAKMLESDSDNTDGAADKSESSTPSRLRRPRKMSIASIEDVDVVPVQRLRRNQQVRRYNENTDSSEEEDDDEGVNIRVSVSSRGRIRRLTAKARASVFRDKS